MKCEICGKDILKDSQCIDYKYYHNDCIINLTKENQKYKEVFEKALDFIDCHFKEMVADEEAQELKSILKEVE